MTDAAASAAREDENWRGGLFTVVVAGPGKLRWGIVVRAADAASARANVEARGHKAIAVRHGAGKGPPATRLTLGACIRCGYTLARLPAGAAGEVMCPECGVINVPKAPLEARTADLKNRRLRIRLWVYGFAAALLLLLVLAIAMKS